MMTATLTLYQQTVTIAQDYLGPAAERFIKRQVAFHLQKDPTLLTAEDLPKLAEWMKISIAILTDDQQMVEEFSQRLSALITAQS